MRDALRGGLSCATPPMEAVCLNRICKDSRPSGTPRMLQEIRMPDPMEKPQPPADKKPPSKLRSQWMMMAWYGLLMLGSLWFWQEQLHTLAVRTIPYSEFKSRLAEGQVVECSVAVDEITGEIDPARALRVNAHIIPQTKPVALATKPAECKPRLPSQKARRRHREPRPPYPKPKRQPRKPGRRPPNRTQQLWKPNWRPLKRKSRPWKRGWRGRSRIRRPVNRRGRKPRRRSRKHFRSGRYGWMIRTWCTILKRARRKFTGVRPSGDFGGALVLDHPDGGGVWIVVAAVAGHEGRRPDGDELRVQ